MGAVISAPQSCCAVGMTRTQRARRMNRRSICSVVAFAALVMLTSGAAAQTLNGFELKGSLVPPDQILHGGPPKDGIPAIDAPRFLPPGGATLAARDRVLGLARNGVAKA